MTQREKQITVLLADGLTSRQMVPILKHSEASIETYRTRLLKKMGVKTSAGLVGYALRKKLIE